MRLYGTDKPDIRFDMRITDLTKAVKGLGFALFDEAPYVGAISAPGCAGWSRKQIDELTEFVRRRR
jgi:aspartyl-tRNA synthetase